MASAGKVLIIVQNLPVPFDRRVWLEATTLRESDYAVAVICPKGKHGQYQESYQLIDDIHIYRYKAPPEAKGTLGYIFEFIYCWLMTSILSIRVRFNHGIDFIHACNPPETYFLLAQLHKIFGTRFIFDHHDLSPEMFLAKGGKRNSILFRGLILLEKLTFQTADVVITTNLSHREIALKRGNVASQDIFVVRSGPDFKRLKRLEPDHRLKNGFKYLVCYLGEMCPQDGVHHIIDVAEMLRNKRNRYDIKFVLIGGGPSLKDLREMSQARGLDSYVEFTGRVSDNELCRYLSSADVCLDPDPYTEWSNQSTMNKIMEYMVFGVPIVAFDLKENRFSAQQAAVYAKANDVEQFASLLENLLVDHDVRTEMGRFGEDRVRSELAWDYSKPNLLLAYSRAINKSESK